MRRLSVLSVLIMVKNFLMEKKMRKVVVILSVCIMFISAHALAAEKIVYQSDVDGDHEIYIMDTDGSNVTQLTFNSAIDNLPQLSPDGTKIVFCSDRDGNREIYSMNVDGTSQTNLTNTSNPESYPAWSHDGAKIAFSSGSNMSYGNIYTMNADGSGRTQLTSFTNNAGMPHWSADGQKIVFQVGLSTSELYTMNADGSGQMQITSYGVMLNEPQWSPDGSKIAFGYNVGGDGSGAKIYTVDADGSGSTNLSGSSGPDWAPSWSPDGSKIVFFSKRDGNYDLYTMNADGSGVSQLTNATGKDYNPYWGVEAGIITTVTSSSPTQFSLEQNMPNPFNPVTTIHYFIPSRSFVELSIYNISGQLVRTLMSDMQTQGYHSVLWNGRNDAGTRVSSGVYIYRLKAGDLIQSRKMSLIH